MSKTDAPTGAPESPSAPADLGQRLRKAREANAVGLRELAKRINVSASLISQVERGKVMPSVGTLYAIVRELKITMDELFPEVVREAGEQGVDDGPVQRKDTRKTIYLGSGVSWEALTTDPHPEMDFQQATYDVGGESCPPDRLMTHGGHEFGYVLGGKLAVTIGEKHYLLEPGDSISFSSSEPHRLANASDEPTETLWVVAGRGRDSRLDG